MKEDIISFEKGQWVFFKGINYKVAVFVSDLDIFN